MPGEVRRVPFSELVSNLAEVVDRVVSERHAIVIERDGADLVVLRPALTERSAGGRRGGRAPGARAVARSREGILRAAGSWKGVNAEAFKAYVYERRRASGRRPVRL